MKKKILQGYIFVIYLMMNACRVNEIDSKITLKEFEDLYYESSFVKKEISVKFLFRGNSLYKNNGGLFISCLSEKLEIDEAKCKICNNQINRKNPTFLRSVLCNHSNYYCHLCREGKQFSLGNNCTNCSFRTTYHSFKLEKLSPYQKALIERIRLLIYANEENFIYTNIFYINYLIFAVPEKLIQNLTNSELGVALEGQRLIGTMDDI